MKRFKVVLLGESGVGKTSLLHRYLHNEFSPNITSTCGSAFSIIKQGEIELNVWDTAGQEAYRSLIPLYTRNASVFLVVYDMTDRYTFDQALDQCEKIYNDYRPYSDHFQMLERPLVILIGNKSDLPHFVFAVMEHQPHFRVSALDDSVKEVFNFVIERLKKHEEKKIVTEVVNLEENPKMSYCCYQ